MKWGGNFGIDGDVGHASRRMAFCVFCRSSSCFAPYLRQPSRHKQETH